MNVAMLGHKRIPGKEGGIETVVEELSIRMVKRGHRVTVFNRKSKTHKTPKIYKGVKIKTVFTIESKSLDATVYSLFASIRVALGKYEVVHYHGIGPAAFLWIPKIFGKRVIVTVHGLNYLTPKWKGLGAKFMKFGEKMSAKYADEVIVLSENHKKFFKREYGRQTSFIPNGVEIKQPREPKIINKEFGLEKRKYNLLVSRIVPGKGIECLLDAYRNVDTDLPLVIAGESNFVSDFHDAIMKKAMKDKRVMFVGFASGEKLEELYSNANMFVFPSEAEGMPMVLLEALSYGIPCVASDIPENANIMPGYVNLFRVNDPIDLARKIKEHIDDSQSKKAISYIGKKYNWDELVEETLSVYGEKNAKNI